MRKNLFIDIPKTIQSLLIFIAMTLIIVFAAPRKKKFMYLFQEGQVWNHELLIAPYDITLLKPEAILQAERDSVVQRILPYYREDKNRVDIILSQWEEDFRKNFSSTYSMEYNTYILTSLKDIYTNGLITDQAKEDFELRDILEINVLNENLESSRRSTTLFISIKEAYQKILQDFPDNLDKSFLELVNVEKYLKANIIYDKLTYDKILREEQQKISRSTGIFVAGRRIVNKGEIINAKTYNVLSSYKKMYEKRAGTNATDIGRMIGIFLIVLTLSLILWFYLVTYRHSFFVNTRNTLFIVTGMLFFILLTELSYSLWSFDIYILPFVILPLLTRIFFDGRTAFFTHLTTILIASIFVSDPMVFIILQVGAGLVTLFSLKDLTSRAQLIRTTSFVFLLYIGFSWSISLMQNGSIERVDLEHVLIFALNIIFMMFSYVLLYLMEKIFGFVSNISLVELSDINRPLLRQLSEVTPGTFQHSMQVSILATEAALAIGADEQLTRTGALYHDIGKMLNPPFFTENNQGGRNPHEDLSYRESASVIIKHITEGIVLAEKNKLPSQVIDFIRTHHGKGMTKYFYTMECNEHPGEFVDPTPFTYPGPNPFTKETGILMLADAVEASSRSLPEYTEESIKNLVERIVDSIIADRLLDNTPLTFKDITEIKAVFVKKLLTMNHSRVAYPKLKKEPQENEEEKD